MVDQESRAEKSEYLNRGSGKTTFDCHSNFISPHDIGKEELVLTSIFSRLTPRGALRLLIRRSGFVFFSNCRFPFVIGEIRCGRFSGISNCLPWSYGSSVEDIGALWGKTGLFPWSQNTVIGYQGKDCGAKDQDQKIFRVVLDARQGILWHVFLFADTQSCVSMPFRWNAAVALGFLVMVTNMQDGKTTDRAFGRVPYGTTLLRDSGFLRLNRGWNVWVLTSRTRVYRCICASNSMVGKCEGIGRKDLAHQALPGLPPSDKPVVGVCWDQLPGADIDRWRRQPVPIAIFRFWLRNPLKGATSEGEIWSITLRPRSQARQIEDRNKLLKNLLSSRPPQPFGAAIQAERAGQRNRFLKQPSRPWGA